MAAAKPFKFALLFAGALISLSSAAWADQRATRE
ncbi:hypothetical protein COLO4_29181 [Corchorus olitorius]|uniref:Uncharacterized protein n=1 Tax=Corchorus olitorius TaxID=93759 RepID=A0A1R3HG82_9ROSI|nr:hypothetical protein COLO4_29181 [Corchorus olitorius]